MVYIQLGFCPGTRLFSCPTYRKNAALATTVEVAVCTAVELAHVELSVKWAKALLVVSAVYNIHLVSVF